MCSFAVTRPVVQVAPALRAQPFAVFTADGLHGLGEETVLSDRLAEIKDVVLINGESPRIGGRRHWQPAEGVFEKKELVLDFQAQLVVKLLETATADVPFRRLQFASYQNTPVRPKQLYLARNRIARFANLVNDVVAY
jgi:hypothetical protein